MPKKREKRRRDKGEVQTRKSRKEKKRKIIMNDKL